MNCEIHHRQIQFVCKSDSCYFLPLCSSCLPEHTPKHKNNELMPISKAIQLARNNLDKQKQMIGQLLFPFQKRRDLATKIEEQKRLLRAQRDRLVKYIDDYISRQISKLVDENRNITLSASDNQLQGQLKKKKAEIFALIADYKKNPSALQKSLNFQLNRFEQKLGQRNNSFSSARYHFYSNINHQIMLSKLQMVSESTTSRNFRKVMNESTLYFLIDSKFNTSPRLFDFNASKRKLHIYNSIDQQWSSVSNDGIAEQGSGIHDHESDKFFWIGGILNGKKTNNIIIYDYQQTEREKRFKQAKLKIPRSSCMTALVTTNYKRGIIIVGGLGEYGEALKQYEFLDFKTMETTLIGQTNFAVFSGTLAVFNNSTVLRLGGLSKNKGYSSIVEVVQKLDCQEAFSRFQNDRIAPRWSYVQLQLPKGDFFSKSKLFYANQAAIQINPNELFIFGGLDAGLSGSTESYLISVEQYRVQSRDVKSGNKGLQQRWTIRWVNEKPLISGDDFGGLKPSIWKERLYSLQNIGEGELLTGQKRLLQFDMYQWYQTDNIQPQ